MAAARGPLKLLLATPAGQYVVIGLGVASFFPEQVQMYLGPLLKYTTGVDSIKQLLPTTNKEEDDNDKSNRNNHSSPAPIIIHTQAPSVISESSSSRSSKIMGTVTYVVLGAGACWGVYAICVHVLPEQISQMMPVSRQVFERTTKTLGEGLLKVKEVLEEKILGLSKQQDALGKKQDETHDQVKKVKSELGEARIDLNILKGILKKCEGTLDDTQSMQTYTTRGVKLLIRCVAGFVQHDPNQVDELARYIQDGEGVEDQSRNNNNKYNHSNPRHSSAKLMTNSSSSSSSATTPSAFRVVVKSQQQQPHHEESKTPSDADCDLSAIHALISPVKGGR